MIQVQSVENIENSECFNCTARCTAFINEVGGQVVYNGAVGEESIQRRVEAQYHQLLVKVSDDS